MLMSSSIWSPVRVGTPKEEAMLAHESQRVGKGDGGPGGRRQRVGEPGVVVRCVGCAGAGRPEQGCDGTVCALALPGYGPFVEVAVSIRDQAGARSTAEQGLELFQRHVGVEALLGHSSPLRSS